MGFVIMATSFVDYEFCCAQCCQAIQLSTEYVGYLVACPNCQLTMEAPALPELPTQLPSLPEPVSDQQTSPAQKTFLPECTTGELALPVRKPSVDELRKAAHQSAKQSQAKNKGIRCANPDRMSAPRTLRVLAAVIDAIAGGLAFGLGVIPIMMVVAVGHANTPVVERYVKFICYDVALAR